MFPPYQETPEIREVDSEQEHIYHLSGVCFVVTPSQVVSYLVWVQVLHCCHCIYVIITILRNHAHGS